MTLLRILLILIVVVSGVFLLSQDKTKNFFPGTEKINENISLRDVPIIGEIEDEIFNKETQYKSSVSANDDSALNRFLNKFQEIKEAVEESDKKIELDEFVQGTVLPEFSSMCIPQIERVCSVDGCSTNEVGASFNLINDDAKSISICRSSQCVSYSVEINTNNGFKHYYWEDLPGQLLIKEDSSNQNNAYLEILTSGINTMLRYGNCRENNI